MAQRLPTVVRRQHWEALMAAARTERDHALMSVMLYAGLRVSEACGLELRDLDLHPRAERIHLRPENAKRNKEAYQDLGPKCVASLKRYLAGVHLDWTEEPGGTPLFPSPGGKGKLTRQRAWQIVKAAGERAGVGDIWPHVLRHSFATGLLERGARIEVVRDAMRHKSVTTTEIYTRLANLEVRNAVNDL